MIYLQDYNVASLPRAAACSHSGTASQGKKTQFLFGCCQPKKKFHFCSVVAQANGPRSGGATLTVLGTDAFFGLTHSHAELAQRRNYIYYITIILSFIVYTLVGAAVQLHRP